MSKKAPKKRLLEHWQKIAIALAIFDCFAVSSAYFLALLARFDFQYTKIDPEYLKWYVRFLPIYILVCLLVFLLFRLYHFLWRYAGFSELLICIGACTVTGVLHVILMQLLFGRMPLSYYAGGYVLQTLLIICSRFSFRAYLIWKNRYIAADLSRENRKNVLIFGAGEAGRSIFREVENSKDSTCRVCCFIDDNPNKWGRLVDGVRVFGGRDDLMLAVKKYKIDIIYIAIPKANMETRRNLVNLCKETDCEVKILPGVMQLVNGEVSIAQMKDVAVEDLLGRDVVAVNNEEIAHQLTGKVVLVTGGGGSIGSELCRQIARQKPKTLVILDIYENNAYEIQQELLRKYPELHLVVLIGSVRDSRRLDDLFSTYRPDIVFHAAAHKHVPLMEVSPCEAVKNNVVGTYKTAVTALRYGTKRFVLISTDKAVNPTNVMGASKRICEMVIQTLNEFAHSGKLSLLPELPSHQGSLSDLPKRAETDFVAVRFGNVLGSNGSVIPLFRKQIEAGGPVTVTHPDIIRYFMTIPEAVSLVLQAGSFAKGGEIFVLDMGDPVKIDTLARNLIKLSGYTPDEDIKVIYTGLRPGEKLYEEKLMGEEGLTTTSNRLIFIGKPVLFDREIFLKELSALALSAYANDEKIAEQVMDIVRFGGAKEVPQENRA